MAATADSLIIDLDMVAVGSEMERQVLDLARKMLKSQAARVAELEGINKTLDLENKLHIADQTPRPMDEVRVRLSQMTMEAAQCLGLHDHDAQAADIEVLESYLTAAFRLGAPTPDAVEKAGS